MKLSNFLCIVFTVSTTQAVVAAYRYDLRCQDKKIVWLNTGEKPPPSSDCQTFLKNGFSKCYDTRKTPASPNAITISAPNDQYYSSKESDKYDRRAIQEVIRTAVLAGNDPYLALSLVVVENPPMVDSVKDDLYSRAYGHIPIDKIGIADVFNCDAQIESYNSQKSMKTYINKGELREFNIDPREPQRIICLTPGAKVGSAPAFGVLRVPNEKYCCSKIRIKMNTQIADHESSRRLRSYLANEYIEKRFKTGVKRAEKMDTPAEKMATIAQAYNGYGTFGATEKMKNSCLTRVDMGKTPVYGSGVSETMLNSLMNNSEIKKMIDDATRSVGQKPSSYLCQAYGDGDHKISGTAFIALQKRYIGSRPHCPRHTYALKGAARVEQATSSRGSGNSSSSKAKKAGAAK